MASKLGPFSRDCDKSHVDSSWQQEVDEGGEQQGFIFRKVHLQIRGCWETS
jgi:hypothetical protein